jgi:addiction module HigA family antidote
MARFINGMRPIHPGEILREEYLAPLRMTPNALATALHVTANRINDIVLERRGVTPDTALRLARYFGGEPEFWLNMQQTYDLKVAQQEHGAEIANEIAPREEEHA